MRGRYSASPPINVPTAIAPPTSWAVWDHKKASFCTQPIYTQEFAKILAAAMNMAYAEGVKDQRNGTAY